MRGVMWESWMDGVLLERYADTENAELAVELGVSVRSVERHAAALGLSKSERFLLDVRRRALDQVSYLRLIGRKIGGGKKGGTPGSFKKGHRLSEEVERKRVKALQDLAWNERVRLIRGIPRKTRWKMK